MAKKGTITRGLTDRIWELVGYGLPSGLGVRGHGTMCVQACVNAALEEGHGDRPFCVSSQMTTFGITLNDRNGWDSDKSRGEGLKRWAIAQLGSSEEPEQNFAKFFVEELFATGKFVDRLKEAGVPKKYLTRAKKIRAFPEAFELAKEIIRERPDGVTLYYLQHIVQREQYWFRNGDYSNLPAYGSDDIPFSDMFELLGYAHDDASNRELSDLGVKACQKMKTEGSDWLKEYESRSGEDLVEWLLEEKKKGAEQEEAAKRFRELTAWLDKHNYGDSEKLEKVRLEEAAACGSATN
jgi:hypothetical protein